MASARVLIGPHRFLLEHARERILETSSGSRLLAYVSSPPASRGLIVILHGWEGSSSSAYVLAAGAYFYRRGFSVARLNLRDHGESHHLNEGLFHGALLDETCDAVNALALDAGADPVYLMGFSLGANFACASPFVIPKSRSGSQAGLCHKPPARSLQDDAGHRRRIGIVPEILS
jgi:predicted alpha/beta-fold hydrolase